VDIGTHAVKLAQVVRDGAGLRLHGAAVIQRPTAWPDGDRLAFEQPVSSRQEIRAARTGGRFAGRNAVCLLPMNVCQLRGLNVPPGDDHERRSMIGDELAPEWEEQQVAMNFDFWELEAAPADKGPDSHNVNVLAVARPWITQLASDCSHAGLNCWAIDGVPLAMARAVSLAGGPGSGRRALAVDWGFSNTTLCIVGDGRAWYTRRVSDCAFGKALDLISQRLGVTLDQAQYLVDAHGITSPDDDAADRTVQEALTDAIDKVLDGLRDQMRRTLQFLELQRRHLHPMGVWLMGGGASLRNVVPWLAAEMQLPVHLWNIPCEEEACRAGNQRAVFAGAAALSAMAWRVA
jgi:Tfp pilus assembly PilM family ATPase